MEFNKHLVGGTTRRSLLKAGAALAVAPALMTLDEARAQSIVPKRGGTLTSLLTPEPVILMIGVNATGPTLVVASKMFQSLFTYTDTLDFKPVLARSWEISDDKRVYKFNLQKGVKFHDGTPMTSEDVAFSAMKFMRALSLRSRVVFEPIEKVETLDEHTAVFTLKEPLAAFMMGIGGTALPIVPKHLNDVADYRNNPNNAKPIGTGPFKFAEWSRGSFIRLTRHDEYWKPGQPYLDEIIYRIVPDSQSRALALQSGQVLLAGGSDIEPFDLPRFRQQPGLNVTTKGWEYYGPMSWIEMNKRVKPLDDVRVRRAMSMAIDRDFVVQKLWFGIGKPATGPFCATTRNYDPDVKMLPFDIAAANKLLDEAGYKADSRGLRFTIRHLSLPYGEVWTRLSEYFRAAMQKVGINVVVDSVDGGTHSARMGNWEFETSVSYIYQAGDANIGLEQYLSSANIKRVPFNNVGGYRNDRVDQILATTRTLTDLAERQKLLSELQRIVIEDMPYLFLTQMSFPTYYSSKLSNPIASGMGISDNFDDVFFT
ncbi:ABC transporter substrate-binding protein [Bradyrhizobium erythrophlei]|uniref:ABC transporter substrate-binding protein n=1 Tax=Bradyrhizobium erythrophlei TaxID=1437360 RepID=UPI0035EF68DC